MKTIRVAEDFSKHPAGRYPSDGPYSGEKFRENLLKPALENGGAVEVILDGTAGYGSSFLEEAFGGLLRKGYVTPKDVGKRLHIIVNDRLYEPYRLMVLKYIGLRDN